MSRKSLAMTLMAGLALAGCGPAPIQPAGYLTTYQNLDVVSPTLMRYVAPNNLLGNYNKIIIEPVVVQFYDLQDSNNIAPEDLQHLQQYFYIALTKAVTGSSYQIVTAPGPGVLRLRAAITNLKKSSPALNVLPQTKLSGMGLGQATVEAELDDSVSALQVAAVIESQSGNQFSFDGLSQWGDVEAVMNGWADRLRKRLDEARAPQTPTP